MSETQKAKPQPSTTGSELSGELGRAARSERDRCLAAVAVEEELPGRMPDEMWEAIRNDRDVMEEALRTAVRLAKQGIKERIEAV